MAAIQAVFGLSRDLPSREFSRFSQSIVILSAAKDLCITTEPLLRFRPGLCGAGTLARDAGDPLGAREPERSRRVSPPFKTPGKKLGTGKKVGTDSTFSVFSPEN